MIELLRKTRNNIGFNLSSILIFEVAYKAVFTMLSWEALRRGTAFALRKAGYSYLTGKNIIPFLFKPFTLLVLAGLIVMQAFILGIELTALLTAYQSSMIRKKVGPGAMLIGGLRKYIRAFQKSFLKLPAMMMGISLILNLVLAPRILMHIRPVNAVIREIWRSQAFSILFVLALILFLGLMLPHILVTEACFLGKLTFREGMQESRRILKHYCLRIVPVFVILNLLIAGFIFLLYMIFSIGAAAAIIVFAESHLSFAVMLRTCSSIELLLLFGGMAVSTLVNHSFLSAVYFKFSGIITKEEDIKIYELVRSKISKKTAGIIAGVGFLIYCIYIVNLVGSGTLLARNAVFETQITAHRGSSIAAPENTIPALERAIEEMSDYAEIDLQETKDGVVVLLHDSSLKRTTGVSANIWTLDYQEVLNLDASAGFANYQDVKVPTFEEVLELCKGKINLNIELKAGQRYAGMPDKVVAFLHEYDFVGQCVITSTSLSMLNRVKELDPEIKTGYIISAAYGNYYEDEAVDFISIRSSFVTESMINRAHSYGKEVHAWTVNSKAEMERLKLLGVDNIITDRPLYAREILLREDATANIFAYLKTIFQ